MQLFEKYGNILKLHNFGRNFNIWGTHCSSWKYSLSFSVCYNFLNFSSMFGTSSTSSVKICKAIYRASKIQWGSAKIWQGVLLRFDFKCLVWDKSLFCYRTNKSLIEMYYGALYMACWAKMQRSGLLIECHYFSAWGNTSWHGFIVEPGQQQYVGKNQWWEDCKDWRSRTRKCRYIPIISRKRSWNYRTLSTRVLERAGNCTG